MGSLRKLGVLLAALTLGACGFSDTGLAPAPPQVAAKFAADEAKPKPVLPGDDTAITAPAAPAPVKPAAAPVAASPPVAAPEETRKPFVVIRFEAPDPDFAPALYDAVHGALTRRPGTAFDLVAVTRDAASAEHDLASVTRALTAMGMPSERLTLAAASAAEPGIDEVWIYVR